MVKKNVPAASETPTTEAEFTGEVTARKGTQKAARGKASRTAPAAGAGDFDATGQRAAARRIEILTARISELETALLQKDLDTSGQALTARIKRLEKDVATYREARTSAEFIATDVRASLDRSAVTLEQLRASPAYRLGSLLIAAGGNWREFVRLPAAVVQWARESRRHREEVEGRLIPAGSATEYTAAVERALEIAEKDGPEAAERWTIDQRFRAPVSARILSELAGLARRRDPGDAVRLAEAALEADPSESRVKRLAFLMAEAGSVSLAAQMLRSALEKGAVLNATEEARAHEVFALSDIAAAGPALLPKRRWIRPSGAASTRALIFAPQAYPFHWSSLSIRTHAMALALTEGGVISDVVTVPGYPNLGRRTPIDCQPTRSIDGITYHILPATKAAPGFGDDYVKQTALLIASNVKRLGATMLIAPADFAHAYPAAVAAQIAGASLVLDCSSVAPDEAQCGTERSQLFSRIEGQLFPYAQVLLARTPAIAARLQQAAPGTSVCLLPDSTPRAASSQPAERSADGEFVFGYVGDNALDIELERLGTLLSGLLAANVNARLVIYAVGARLQAIRAQLVLEGLGSKVAIIEKSPPGRRLELAYGGFDAIVVPQKVTEDVIKSPFQIVSALRNHKCVVALGAAEDEALFGSAVIHAPDDDAALRTLCELAGDTDRIRRQEAEARLWDERHPSNSLLVQTVTAL